MTSSCVNDNVVHVILTHYILEPNLGKGFLSESSLWLTVDLTKKCFNHREIIQALKHTGKLNLYRISLKLNEWPQYHMLKININGLSVLTKIHNDFLHPIIFNIYNDNRNTNFGDMNLTVLF